MVDDGELDVAQAVLEALGSAARTVGEQGRLLRELDEVEGVSVTPVLYAPPTGGGDAGVELRAVIAGRVLVGYVEVALRPDERRIEGTVEVDGVEPFLFHRLVEGYIESAEFIRDIARMSTELTQAVSEEAQKVIAESRPD